MLVSIAGRVCASVLACVRAVCATVRAFVHTSVHASVHVSEHAFVSVALFYDAFFSQQVALSIGTVHLVERQINWRNP